MMPAEKFDLFAAKLKAAKAQQQRDLIRMVYADGSLPPVVFKPVRWWTPIYWRVHDYLLNLWDAICGRMPPDVEDW